MKRIKWTAKRVALGFALSLAATAAAFFVATYLSDGTGEGKTGSAGNFAQPVTITVPDGLTPTNPVAVTATVNNTSGGPRQWQGFTMKIETPTVPVCGESWLRLRPKKSNGDAVQAWLDHLNGEDPNPLKPIPTGVQNIFAFNAAPESTPDAVWLEFTPGIATSTDQSSCEDVMVKVTGSLTES